MKRFCYIFLSNFLLFTSLARAHELFFSFNHEIQSFYLSPQNSAPYFGRSELLTKGEVDFLENLKFKLDTSSSATFMNKQDQKSFLFNPTQLGLSFSSKFVEFFGGAFTYAGDGADINNIFDVVNAKDYRQPFNARSMGSVGALVTLPFDAFTLKAFFIPKNEKSLLPDTQSPWWPRTEALPIRNASGTFLSPDNMSYRRTYDSEYEEPFLNNFGGSAKVGFSNFDISFFYFKGANQTPKISPHFNLDLVSLNPLIGVIQPPVELSLTWYRSEHVGIGSTLVVGDWIAKAFCKNQKDYLPKVENSTACTGTIENSIAISRFSLRYFLQVNRIWKQEPDVQELETLLGFFERSTAAGLYLDMDTAGTVSGAVIYNEKDPSTLTSIGYEYKFTDQFKTKLTVNAMTASGSNALGNAYDKTDNATLAFGYDF